MASFGGDTLSTLLGIGVIVFLVLAIWSKVTGKSISRIIHNLLHRE